MQRQGYVLIELITAIVVLSAMLLWASQMWQFQQQQQQRKHWLDDIEQVRHGALSFWVKDGRAPLTIDEFLSTEQQQSLLSPWQSPWQFTLAEHWLELAVTAPDANQAQWLSNKVAGAFVRAEQVIIPIWAPAAQGLDESYLYRQAVPDKPHLNSMMTDLDMGGHDILNAGAIEADQVSTSQLHTWSINADNLNILSVAEAESLYAADVITPFGSLSELKATLNQFEVVWGYCVASGKCQ